jgi:hypothetical protein
VFGYDTLVFGIKWQLFIKQAFLAIGVVFDNDDAA